LIQTDFERGESELFNARHDKAYIFIFNA